jgi:hypothetical protein
MPNYSLNLLPFWKGDKGDSGDPTLSTDLANTTDLAKGAAMVGRGAVTLYNVVEFQTAKRATDLNYQVRGYHPGTTYGGGLFRYDATKPKSAHNGGTVISPTVPWDGTQGALANFLDGVGEADPSGMGCFVRDHGFQVYVSWFGAKGDAVRPSASVPDAEISGTNDTASFAAARDYIQLVSFQPNFFVGFQGSFELCLEPNSGYKLVGNNVLGSTLPRSTADGDAGALSRQNWFVNGNYSIVFWECTATDDTFIETHETITRPHAKRLRVYGCKIVGAQGTFFSNIANPGRNALAIQAFEDVEVYHVQPNSTVNGWKKMFNYEGSNLGDRLYTSRCSFNQFHTFIYSENPEAVGQGITSTSITSYITGAKWFHFRTHGSGFHVGDGCNILMKADQQTLFKLEYLSGSETGTNGSSTYMDLTGCRLEGEAGMRQTLADCDFGVTEIRGITQTKGGGLPHIDSNTFIARKGAVIKVANSNVYGRVVSGTPNTSTLRIRRAYSVLFDNCSFIGDLGKLLYIEDGSGNIVSWRDAVVGAYQVPPVVVQNTDSRTIGFDGQPTDSNSYVFDGHYPCGMQYNTVPKVQKLQVHRHRTSSQRYYLDNVSYQVLPPYITITSIKITHAQIAVATMDTLRVKVGTAQFDYTLTNNVARNSYELLQPGQVITISDNDVFERTIATECRVGGGLWASPSFIASLEIEWRPANALNEITTTEVAGVRQTRIITSGAQGWIGEIRTATSGTVALTTATPTNVTSVSLPPGVHDVTGNVLFSPQAGDTMTAARVSISTTSATHAAAPEYTDVGPVSVPAAGGMTATAFMQRIDLAATTTVYLVATATHAGGTLNSQGKIRAVRVRQGG